MPTSITTIQSTDLITDSRADINNNFDSLSTNKIETSVIDTDTTLAANSDAKLPSQKAVKAYVDAGGNINATTTAKGIVEIATQTQTNAGTALGDTGASLAVTPETLSSRLSTDGYVSTFACGNTTYDISTASGTQTIAHGLGAAPSFVRLRAVVSNLATSASGAETSTTETTYNGTTQASVYIYHASSSSAGNSNSTHGVAFRVFSSLGDYQSGVITYDATNITITWTKTASPTGTANIMWEATA